MGDIKQPWFGFTRREQGVVLALAVLVVTGIGVRLYRQSTAGAPRVNEEDFFSGLAPLEAEPAAGDEGGVPVAVPAEPVKPQGTRKPEPAVPASVMGPVNINRATEEELVALPQIGPALAGRIVEYRRQQGPFRQPADLQKVKGIGEKKYKKLAPFITVE